MPETLPVGWALAAAVNQWLLYCAVLFAVGSVLFLLWMPSAPAVRLRAISIGRTAAILGAITYVLAVGLIGADVFGDPAGIFAARAWTFGLQTTLSTSAIFGVSAMALLLVGTAAQGRLQRFAYIGGCALGAGSLLVTGHPAVAAPRWLTTPAYAAHLLGAAFWMGALAPLAFALRTLAVAERWRMVAAFSRRATYAVGAIVASGVVLGAVHLGSVSALTESSYGQRLMVKFGLATAIFAIAAYNKVVLTPRLERGDAIATARLRLMISAEIILLVITVGAAVALTLVQPPALD